MLSRIEDINDYKKKFKQKLNNVLVEYNDFRIFLYEVFLEGHTAYVVGGFLRDIILNNQSRDLDIILGVPPELLKKLLSASKLNYVINRLGGAKILLDNFQIDIWSIDNNWGFKNKLIKRNEQNIVDNISACSFYNFDSLAINIHSLEICTKHFNQCIDKNELDILRKNINYKVKNPTIEANILRAFFLKSKYDLNLSQECKKYLTSRIRYLKDNNESAIKRLIDIKRNYQKYDKELSDVLLKEFVIKLLREDLRQGKFSI